MSEHLVVNVDRLLKPPPEGGRMVESVDGPAPAVDLAGPSSCPSSAVAEKENVEVEVVVDGGVDNEHTPLIMMAECRICQEEDSVSNLETPCACSGSLKFAHRKCVQHWCNEKGDITCEICHQPYRPGYTAPPRPVTEETTIDIGGEWQISGTPLDLHDPRLLAIAEAERQFLEAEYEDYNTSNASGAAFCRSVALVLMALLLLRHALTVADSDDDASTFFFLFLLRAAGFLLPCYIMAWAISILQQRRQRQEAAAARAATRFAFVLQSGQRRGVHVTIASAAPATAPTVATQLEQP